MGFGFLFYPYNHTVFPRGLIAPTIQLKSTVAALDATYVTVTGPGIDSQGFYGASNPGRVVFSPAVWTAITLASTGAPDSIKVEITETSAGKVSGPIDQVWTRSPPGACAAPSTTRPTDRTSSAVRLRWAS